jgi:DNA-binding transcriptional LysR family regulator
MGSEHADDPEKIAWDIAQRRQSPQGHHEQTNAEHDDRQREDGKSDLVARPVTMLERITCAAPAYLQRYGCPQTPDDRKDHRAVGIRLISTGALTPIEFVRAGGVRQVDMPAPFSATGTETFRSAVLLGLGLAQIPVFHIDRDLVEGRLVRILANYATPSAPVSILYPRSRQLSPRVPLFIDWMVQRFSGTRDLS